MTHSSIIKSKESGFTLVELAIVMIIIGLLIGGVLKGQQLIENAKVTSTIAQMQGFQAALNAFRDTYSSMPGDMRNANLRIPGCGPNPDAAGNFCAIGNGNNLVDGGLPGDSTDWSFAVTSNEETNQAWKHMALAGLISSVASNADTASASWGQTHPSSDLRGGYELYYAPTIGTGGGRSGHYLRMSNQGLSGGTIGTAGTAPASPLQAAQIDRKIDDGRPLTGSVLANYGDGTGCHSGGATAAYQEQTQQKNCVLFYLIDG